MPNKSQISGLNFQRHMFSTSHPALTKVAFLAADGTATFIGDAVTLTGTSDADGVPAVKQYAVGDREYGRRSGDAECENRDAG